MAGPAPIDSEAHPGGAALPSPRSSRAPLRRLRRSAIVERVRASLWFLPSLFVAGAVVSALGLSQVEVDESSPLGHLVFPGGADSARAILQAIAGSVITVTGVVFSLTVVTLQLASTQFSPRLLRTFLRDVSNQLVLATFLATFTYALVALRTVQSGETPQDDVVPALAITAAYVLTGASVVALVYFIDHIARSIRIDSLMREVNEDTVEVINDLSVAVTGACSAGDAMPTPPTGAAVITAPRSGFVQGVDGSCLIEAGSAAGVSLRLEVAVGDRVIEGAPLARAWRPDGDAALDDTLTKTVRGAVQLGYERTMQQDVAYGFRQLVDIAVKALSPGVNDPTTAVDAVGHLAALLVVVARRPHGPRVYTNADSTGGALHVVVPAMDLQGYLDLACGQIRRYGAREPAVMVELLRMLRDVARCDLDHDERRAVLAEADKIVAAAERETADAGDLRTLDVVHNHLLDALEE